MSAPRIRNVCIVGPSDRFKSGLSQYTFRLAKAFDEHHHVSVLLLRRLIPQRFYPGAARVGADLGESPWPRRIRRFDGIDWYWGRTLTDAFRFLRRDAPDVLILQWWTGAVLHTYLALCMWARVLKVPVVMEFHEVIDTGEAKISLVAAYSKRLMGFLLRQVSAVVVHNESDLRALRQAYKLDGMPIAIAPHGPYDHLVPADLTEVEGTPADLTQSDLTAADDVEADVEIDLTEKAVPVGHPRLLFFGLIRPYKGLDVFIRAFNGLGVDDLGDASLTVVGETWENYREPAELIARSPYRARITFTNRYVNDEEVPLIYANADVLVLPYLRLSSSGPLSIAMSIGMPVLVSDIPEMHAALGDYEGAVYCTFESADDLARALRTLDDMVGQRFPSTRSWSETLRAYETLFVSMAS